MWAEHGFSRYHNILYYSKVQGGTFMTYTMFSPNGVKDCDDYLELISASLETVFNTYITEGYLVYET